MDSSFNLAVHALVCLSHSGRSLSSEALAENICTNPTRVRRVLAGLKKAGMVETREGLDGGYRLCTDPAALSLRQVAEAINTRFVDCAWHSGDIDRDCAICSGMAGVMDALYRQMNEQCAAYLSHITITDIETQLLLRVKEPPLGVLASADNPRQPRSVGVLQMDEAATVCIDRQDSVSSYNLIIFCLNSKSYAELKEPNRTTGAAPRRFSQIM